MIITIAGTAGSGKSTVGKLLAKKLGYKFYSMGDLRRKYSMEHEMTIEELNRISETDPFSDRLVDQYQSELGRKEDNFIIDSRLGFHFIPHSYKIFFDAFEKIRAGRIMSEERASERFSSVAEAMQKLRERQSSDEKRYSRLYSINPYDISRTEYDLLVDTSQHNPAEVVALIKLAMAEKHNLG